MEPSQSSKVGQKTTIIRGVPLLTRKRKFEERTAIILAIMAVLFLNQRFKRRIRKRPRKPPIMILGIITE